MESDLLAKRYMLCRPTGGLNDTFCHIERCFVYAKRFHRTLIIDLSFSDGLTDLRKFFLPLQSDQEVVLNANLDDLRFLNALDCFPTAFSGKLFDYKTVWGRDEQGTMINRDSKSGVSLQIDLSIDYPEPMLLYHHKGGADFGIEFLKRFTLEAHLADEVLARILAIGPDYSAVHIRNSDYKTDWVQFLRKIRRQLRNKTVLVCSDDFEVVQEVDTILESSSIKRVSDVAFKDGKPLHIREISVEAKDAVARSALIDLLALGGASDLYITPTKSGPISGFSQLAGSLCRNKDVINSLLGREVFSVSKAVGKVHLVQTFEIRLRFFLFRLGQSYRRRGMKRFVFRVFQRIFNKTV